MLVSIGNGSAPDSHEDRASDPAAAGVIRMLYSASITGPWKQRRGVILAPGATGSWDSFVSNPSLFFFPNGSVLMAYRGGPCLGCPPIKNGGGHHIGIATASAWDQEFKRIGDAPVFTTLNEDPGIFQDHRGSFHMLTHMFSNSSHSPGFGGHAFSANGLDWTFAGQAYVDCRRTRIPTCFLSPL